MDRRTDEGSEHMTPLERVKADHALKRMEILFNDEDVLDWDRDITPEQVGLHHVWADDNGKLWVIVRDGERLKLQRIWHIT